MGCSKSVLGDVSGEAEGGMELAESLDQTLTDRQRKLTFRSAKPTAARSCIHATGMTDPGPVSVDVLSEDGTVLFHAVEDHYMTIRRAKKPASGAGGEAVLKGEVEQALDRTAQSKHMVFYDGTLGLKDDVDNGQPLLVIRSLARSKESLGGKVTDMPSERISADARADQVMYDATGDMKEIMKKELHGMCWTISTLKPVVPGQRPSGFQYKGQDIYDKAEIRVAKPHEAPRAVGTNFSVYNVLTAAGKLKHVWTWGNIRPKELLMDVSIRYPLTPAKIITRGTGAVNVIGEVQENEVTVSSGMDPVAAVALGMILRQQLANDRLYESKRATIEAEQRWRDILFGYI